MKSKITEALFIAALYNVSTISFLSAQPKFTALYSFTNSAGAYATLILSSNRLYGTTFSGGRFGAGTVFAIGTDGANFTNLYNFTALSNSTNADGAYPAGRLALSGKVLFGTAYCGGRFGGGTVFALNIDGTGFRNLHTFTYGADGSLPYAGLILSGNTLYGSASGGGSSGNGTIFKVNVDGTDFTNIHSFNAATNGINSDGFSPLAGLVLSENILYGTANTGGGSETGTIFKLNTNGAEFTVLHSFTAHHYSSGTNGDGAYPSGGLILSGDTLYGTTYNGGSSGQGVVFKVNIDGTGFETLHSFSALSNSTNIDGANPWAALILSGNHLYGTTENGGSPGNGTVFACNTNGGDFTNLHSFAPLLHSTNNEGAFPQAGLVILGDTLYGAAPNGGNLGHGTVFTLNLIPPLGIISASNQVAISWPTWAPNFGLQTTTDPLLGSWSNILTGITEVNGSYLFTNAASGNAAFFRLQSL
jgi:uncharacterized repeat protein (TIGR03803 family)